MLVATSWRNKVD